MFLNTRVPPFDHLDARRALNFAVDRRAVVALEGGARFAQPPARSCRRTSPATGPTAPTPRRAGRGGPWTAPDLARARRLVARSHTRGMRVTVLGTEPGISPVMRDDAEGSRRAGVQGDAAVAAGRQVLRLRRDSRNRPQIGHIYFAADYPAASDFLQVLFSCGAGGLLSGFCDPTSDRLMRARAAAAGRESPVGRRVGAGRAAGRRPGSGGSAHERQVALPRLASGRQLPVQPAVRASSTTGSGCAEAERPHPTDQVKRVSARGGREAARAAARGARAGPVWRRVAPARARAVPRPSRAQRSESPATRARRRRPLRRSRRSRARRARARPRRRARAGARATRCRAAGSRRDGRFAGSARVPTSRSGRAARAGDPGAELDRRPVVLVATERDQHRRAGRARSPRCAPATSATSQTACASTPATRPSGALAAAALGRVEQQQRDVLIVGESDRVGGAIRRAERRRPGRHAALRRCRAHGGEPRRLRRRAASSSSTRAAITSSWPPCAASGSASATSASIVASPAGQHEDRPAGGRAEAARAAAPGPGRRSAARAPAGPGRARARPRRPAGRRAAR